MSRIERAPVSSSTSQTTRRRVTFERRGEGHAALLALLDVVLRLLELVLDELERGPLGEVADREDRLEDLLQADVAARFRA